MYAFDTLNESFNSMAQMGLGELPQVSPRKVTAQYLAGVWKSYLQSRQVLFTLILSKASNPYTQRYILKRLQLMVGVDQQQNQLHQFQSLLNEINLTAGNIRIEAIEKLSNKINDDDKFLLGLMLAFDILCFKNHRYLLEQLSFTDHLMFKLRNSDYFIPHLSKAGLDTEVMVKKYIDECKSIYEKESFLDGFLTGIDFWSEFWEEALQNQA
jgi:hypothetical protein